MSEWNIVFAWILYMYKHAYFLFCLSLHSVIKARFNESSWENKRNSLISCSRSIFSHHKITTAENPVARLNNSNLVWKINYACTSVHLLRFIACSMTVRHFNNVIIIIMEAFLYRPALNCSFLRTKYWQHLQSSKYIKMHKCHKHHKPSCISFSSRPYVKILYKNDC